MADLTAVCYVLIVEWFCKMMEEVDDNVTYDTNNIPNILFYAFPSFTTTKPTICNQQLSEHTT